MIRSSDRKRDQTRMIVVHVLKNVPETVTECDLNDLYRGLGFFNSPFHFVLLPNGEIDDARDVTAVGGYLLDTLDIAVLCGDRPSSTQQNSLKELIAALFRDSATTAKPEVKTIEEERFHSAIA